MQLSRCQEQAQDTTLQEALVAVNMAKLFLQRQRDDCAFERFYANTEKEAKQYNIEPVLPRYRRPPRHLDDGASPHVDKTPQDYYRRQYFEVLDLLSGELTRRFHQRSLAAPKAIEQVLLTACALQFTSADGFSIPEVIVNTYSQDLNIDKLKVQLLILPDLIKTYRSSQDLPHLKVTSLRTL